MRVYIGGDSWGCGEWAVANPFRNWHTHRTIDWSETYDVQHKGLEQYLIDDGHTVTNTSKPGGGNAQIYEQLAKSEEHDIYVIFQTASIRDNKDWNTLITWNNFIVRNEELQTIFYKNLGSLPQKIYLLGGLEKVNKDQVSKYPNLVTLINSIPEWLTNGNYIDEMVISWGKNQYYDNLSKDVDIDVLDKLIENIDYWSSTVAVTEQYFWPDGRHPNRHAHLKIYNILKKEIKTMGQWCQR